uniref:transmembrane protein KIAA1109-like isoform X2 n=1 Tax=Styela clava TaxID=7725 RepID=UPI00193A546B|nr:transmembrane protein KIAA1109-like isoform X2 [Styela clava]
MSLRGIETFIILLLTSMPMFGGAQSTILPNMNDSSTWTLFDESSQLNQKSGYNCTDDEVLVNFECIDKGLRQSNSSLLQLFLVVAVSMLWIIYITYYNSRLIGFILTKLLNQFIKDGHFKLGSFSFSVLSGKVMFRDVQYITPDLSVRIHDGYFIFRWWRPYKFSPWRKKRDLNQGHTRLSVHIYGLEYHEYNRSDVYQRLEELFGLDSNVFNTKTKHAKQSPKKSDGKKSQSQKIAWWRNLIPVIKITIYYGKVIFGNRLLPSTLVVAFEDANSQYKTTKASNKYDLFMHVLEGTMGSLRVMLVPSSKYDPAALPANMQVLGNDPPPRTMSEGFDLIHANIVSFKYMWDEPGKTGVPIDKSKFSKYEAKSSDMDSSDDNSVWELEVRCERRLTMNYGPWADRQVNQLWRFFYPLDYKTQQITPESKQGEIRMAPSFSLYINLLHESDIDLLFMKNDEASAIHINLMKGSCVEMNVPMTVSENGFTTNVSGQLIYPDATTSMSFRPLISAETLSFNISANYPPVWNSQQMWICDIKATKASASLVFDHKNFIADFMDDWSNRESPDLMSFTPYKMKLNFDLQDFELLLPANEHNWVDCASKRKENALVGLTGKSLRINFTLPFHSFLASTYSIPFNFRVMRAELCLFIPLSNPSRNLLLNLYNGMDAWDAGQISSNFQKSDNGANVSTQSSSEVQYPAVDYNKYYENSHRLRKSPQWGVINEEWVKCWDAPEMGLNISYTWHPILPSPRDDYPRNRNSDLNKEIERIEKVVQRQSTKTSKKMSFKKSISINESASTDMVDSTPLLSDMSDNTASHSKSKPTASVMFDPTSLDPDEIRVDFTLKPGSTLYLYGSLLHHFLAIKENYLGVDDVCTDFSQGQQKRKESQSKVLPEQNSDPLYYRTLQVTVNVNLHNIRGILPVHMNPVFKSCPVVQLKKLSFEMDKNYNQTRLQLLLSKLAITIEENQTMNSFDDKMEMDGRKGWLTLMDLQLRGHAMFSGTGLPLGSVTIEYGWLTEVLVGPVTGKLSIPQIQLLTQWIQSFIFLFKNEIHEMKPTFPERHLPTGINWDEMKQDGKPIAEEDVKFLMAQVKLESIKLRVEEHDSVLDLTVSPILISNGNIQYAGVKEAASIRVQEVFVKHRVKKMSTLTLNDSSSAEKYTWVEAGEVRFGSLHAMIQVATPEREMYERQNKFLKFHDKKTRRLHFLWQESMMDEVDSSGISGLSSVRALQSWGCRFFTPLTSKHPTYYYYKSTKSPPRKQATVHDGPRIKNGRIFVKEEEEGSGSSEDDDEDSCDKDSDVFDPKMDYGMSLLVEGKCLLSRSRTLSSLTKKSSESSSESIVQENFNEVTSLFPTVPISAAEVITTAILEDVSETSPVQQQKLRPSLRRQDKINSSTGNMPTLVALESKDDILLTGQAKKASAFRKNRSATFGAPSDTTAIVQQQVSFAPSPEKVSAMRKSSSQTDVDRDVETTRQSMKRALSSDSNLYRSAESDFKSTTSLSSVGDEFYSAESDVNESCNNTITSTLSSPQASAGLPIQSDIIPENVIKQIQRPGTLILENELSGTTSNISTSISNEIPISSTKTPSVTHSFSLSPGSGNSAELPGTTQRSKSYSSPVQSVSQHDTVLACYGSHLTILQLQPPRRKSKVLNLEETDIDDGWFNEDSFLLPDFAVIRDGLHPSVIIDKSGIDDEDGHSHKLEPTQRELSFDNSDSSGKSTDVSIHLRESLDVQLTPFLLDTIGKVMNAATPMVKNENPLSVVSQLEIDCVDDIGEHLPEDEDNNDKDQDVLDMKAEKSRPSLKRQKKTEVSTEEENAVSEIHKVTRPPPGTKLTVKMDKVRLNILQATLGDDKIFSLRSSKLLPTPCVTVLATRLDSLLISVDLNSRRKNRLLMESLRKVSRSSSAASDKKIIGNEPPPFKKVSTSSDLTTHKHFLILLNAKATAKSVAIQMRAMTCDGSVPDMTSITALPDKSCKAPFLFDPDAALPEIKKSLENWKKENEISPESSTTKRHKSSRFQASGPPKFWGWVMFEAGIDRVRINIIKQHPVSGTRGLMSTTTNESQIFSMTRIGGNVDTSVNVGDNNGASAFDESIHVHFMDETFKSLGEKEREWIVQDTSLHASQGELLIGSVWINVPAPSAQNVSSSSRAVRSWNLLSCVSASITCWLDPADVMLTALNRYQEEKLTRHCAVAACVLTETFNQLNNGRENLGKPMEQMHLRYDVLTPKAKFLRKNATFLLCHELQKFLSTEEGRQSVFSAIGPSQAGDKQHPLPALSTLKKGITALLRQFTSQYHGVISSSLQENFPNNGASKKFNGQFSQIKEYIGGAPTDTVTYHRPSLVVEIEIPGETASQQPTAVPRKTSKTTFPKSDTFTSLSAIEEGMSSGSGVIDHPSYQVQADSGFTGINRQASKPITPTRTQAQKMTSAEELVYEQQQSMYSWMSNAAKSSSPTKGSVATGGGMGVTNNNDNIESQLAMHNEVFHAEETDNEKKLQSSLETTDNGVQPNSSKHEMQITSFEEVFEIFLQNIGIDVDMPATQKTVSDKSFIRGECLGSLSVTTKLNLLRVDKQEADAAYNLDSHVRKKRKSSKIRKPRSYYSSLEHAREMREPYVLNTAAWPHIYPGHFVGSNIIKPPPILMCQEIILKSSVIEGDAEMKEGSQTPKATTDNQIKRAAMSALSKKRSTLKVGAELSLDQIVQHVDVALIRLLHQLAQISDNVKQAKTDIQVNKYTEGSVSPDFKVLHRRTDSNWSNGTSSFHRRLNSNTESIPSIPNDDQLEDTDALSNDSASTASTEVPQCWQVMYKMVDLYNTVPDGKTEMLEKPTASDSMHMESEGFLPPSESNSAGSVLRRTTFSLPPHDPYLSLVLKATAGVKKVEMHAAVGDLKLNAEIIEIFTKIDHCKEAINAYKNKATSSFNTTLDAVQIKLVDQAATRTRNENIATASIQHSSLNASTNHEIESFDNVCKLHLGLISFDLSQHPASLHDVVSRGSRQLSAHISEFAQTPTVKQSYYFDHTDGGTPFVPPTLAHSNTTAPPMTPMTPSALTTLIDLSQDSSSAATSTPVNAMFELESEGIYIVASLLPSLDAEYKTGKISGDGRTGIDATFSFSLPSHSLQFTTSSSAYDMRFRENAKTVIDLPEINIDGEYKQTNENDNKQTSETWKESFSQQSSEATISDLRLRSGDYLSVTVHIGSFEHSLTTDLLNQLIFLQEVFVKEINEMMDKVSKTNKPVPLWSETSIRSEESSAVSKPLLYQLKLTLKGIQITAVTPSCNAVRLKTGEMMFELSNRVIQNKNTKKKKKKKVLDVPKYLKLFGKAQVDLTLSLGTLVRNNVYPEAEDDFQQLAYFTTRIGLQNTRQAKDEPRGCTSATAFTKNTSVMDETNPLFNHPSSHSIDDSLLNPQTTAPAEDSDNSVVLVSLKRPLFFIQPTAFDKAILIYLSYKNAYEDWKEQQQNVLRAARQVRDALQSVRSATSVPKQPPQPQRTSTVFLQLSVNDLGICLPVSQNVQLHEVTERDELPTALVLTIDNTLISVYYSRSLTTKGQLKGFCLRFVDDFQTSWDDWRYNMNGSTGDLSNPQIQNVHIMNALVVPEGTYEILSDTTTYHSQSGGPPVAKTTVNVLWKMKGMDVHLDTKIGSYFSRLIDTLMAITGHDEPNYDDDELDIKMSDGENDDRNNDAADGGKLPSRMRSITTSSVSSTQQPLPLQVHKERTRKIEHELNEQVKVVNDLRQLGAKQSVVEEEERRMHDLESALSSNFRRVFKSKLQRSSLKTGSRNTKQEPPRKFRPTHQRAKSAVTGDTGTELPPRTSASAFSTIPFKSKDRWPPATVRDAYSASHMQSNLSSPLHPSPLTYESDHVFPLTPDKNYGEPESFFPSLPLKIRQLDVSDDTDISSDEDDFDGNMGGVPLRSGQALSDLPAARRSLYNQQHNLTSSKSESQLGNISQLTTAVEADLQLELDIRAEVDGGKIECHPHVQEIDVTMKADYGIIPPTYTNSKTRNYVKNTTIFYIPGVDIRVHYNSAISGTVPLSTSVKDKMFSFSPKAMETVSEQHETGPVSAEYITPPPTVTVSSTSANNEKKIPGIPVPNIEITTPSHFGKKEGNVFVMPEPTTKVSPPSTEAKRACVHAKLCLQSLPEMVISPYLLDFLEQTLNGVATIDTPTQSFSQKHSATSSRQGSLHESFPYTDDEASDFDASEINDKQPGDGSVLSSESTLVSLPLDVVVSVNVQPSQVRFNCVPMSRVECLLQIPSMDLAFSSIQDDFDDVSFPPSSQEEANAKKTKPDNEPKLTSQYSESSSSGHQSPKGLSFSAVLSDFSVYVFHPYGGKQSGAAGSSFLLDMTGNSFTASPGPGATDSPFSKVGSGRRDSLSVNLEFVKINLIRKRKGDTIFVGDIFSPGRGRVDNVIVNVSGLLDIGKASFKYDMRRLNEILAFPRAWYRRSIARRLFLGDTSEQPPASLSPQTQPKFSKQARSSTKPVISRSRAHTAPVDNSILSFLTVDSPLSPHQRNLNSRTSHFQPGVADGHSTFAEGVNESPGASNVGPTTWQALVLLEMNMSRLDVEMNIGNVMGNTVWSCDDLKSQGKLMFHSNGDRDINLTCGLENSQINARGGIIGGHIELKKFNADCRLLDPANGDPLHKLGMQAESLDGRIEYMGGCVMMGQLTNVDFQLRDEWRDPVQSIPSNMDKGSVYVHCDLGWRVFQLSISRSTTPDVIKMLSKLEEFFSQQLHSSVRAISSWTQSHARPVSPKKIREPIMKQSSIREPAPYDHRRHWPPVFRAIANTIADSGLLGSRKQLDNRSFLLGGSACLHGDALIVVCFHGANFRSRSWVLFNILQPNIVFSTEVQEIKESVSGDETSTLAIQSLTVNLGHDKWLSRTIKEADPMATVSRVTRSKNQNPPPGSASIPEWFAYMTASHNEELKMLRTLNDIGATKAGTSHTPVSKTPQQPQPGRHNDSFGSLTYSHEADIIFALPKVQLDFKTEHMQGPTEPDPQDTESKPVVDCSFVTEFTDHICVTMDVELILFLHDLISSYLKEKQQALSNRTKLSSLTVNVWNETADGSFTTEPSSSKPLPVDPIDLRDFVCNTWQLEPTVRLISWAGRRIEPVGVDYILHKLGFQHARTTIPKWIQRGVLDLLDKGLAIIVEKLVVAIINQQNKKE